MGALSCGYIKLLQKSKSHSVTGKVLISSSPSIYLLIWLDAVGAVQIFFIKSLPYILKSSKEVHRFRISFNLELYQK